MIYRILADLVALVHFAFILFVLFGGLLSLRWPWMLWAHLPAFLWGAAIGIFGWYCPLTPLENVLRRAAGRGEFTGGFVEHYLLPIMYPSGLTRSVQLALAAVVVVLNVAVYAHIWRSQR